MVRQSRSKGVPRHRAPEYRRVAEGLYWSAEDLFALADERSRYGNAIGVLAVHSAIAWTDALTIGFGGRKHTGARHVGAADVLLEEVGEIRVSSDARKTLQAILGAKDEVSYQGEYYSVEQAMTLLTQLRAYRDWARETFERRPTP